MVNKLTELLFEHSESKYFDEMIDEWKLYRILTPKESNCLCGHKIVHRFSIINKINNNILKPIGSVCILKFFKNTMKYQINTTQKIIDKHNLLFNHGKYKDKTYGDIIKYFSGYVVWLINNRQNSKYEMRKNKAYGDLIFLYNLINDGFVEIDKIDCCICMDDIIQPITTTKCGHKFHSACLNAWFNKKSNCPLCRQNLLF